MSEVFGSSCAEQFVPGERPDFTLEQPDGRVLGVEVTSIYASNTVARDREYMHSLLQDPSRVHRRDRGLVEVLENATLRRGEHELTTNALQIKAPSSLGMLERLKDMIVSKSQKLEGYSNRCHAIDLIIADEAGSLYWQHPSYFRAWLSHFIPRATVLDSGFREIYLTTYTLELGLVSVALKVAFSPATFTPL